MPFTTLKDKLIGWYGTTPTALRKEDEFPEEYFVCDNCFASEDRPEDLTWFPVHKNELDPNDLYVCDVCGARFEKLHEEKRN